MFLLFMLLINCVLSYQILYKNFKSPLNYKLYCISNDNDNQSLQFNKNKAEEIKERLNNLCCGEVNENYEIDEYEKLEKEMLEIFQKMRKHNLKTAYTKLNSLYNLFNKK